MAKEVETKFVEIDIKNLSVKERMVKIANELRIKKSGWNDYGKYAYITSEDVINIVKPFLLKYRLIALFDMVRLENNRNEATLVVSDFDSEEGKQTFCMNVEDIQLKAANSAQSAGALRTFAKRYLLCDAFFIVDGSFDIDSTEHTEDTKAKKKDVKKEENPDQKIKRELQALCQEKAKSNAEFTKEQNTQKVKEILTKYVDSGKVNDMSTANAKLAYDEINNL